MGIDSEWGGTTKGGWKAVPIRFLRRYVQLGITTEEAMFIIMIHSYVQGTQKMHPKVETMARMMGRSVGSVRAYIRSLRKKEYLTTKHRGTHQTYYFDQMYDALDNLVVEEDQQDPYRLDDGDCPDIDGLVSLDSMRSAEAKKAQRLDPDSLDGEDCQDPDTIYREDSGEKRVSPSEKRAGTSLASVIDSALVETTRRASRARERPRARTLNSARAQPRAPASAKEPGQFNCNDVGSLLSEAMQNVFGHVMVVTAKERAQLKAMIKEYGAAETVVAATEMVDRWDELKPIISVTGFPSVALLYGYRRTIVPWSATSPGSLKPSWGAHFNKADERPPGEEAGFSEEFLKFDD